jgi:hypothetical protein
MFAFAFLYNVYYTRNSFIKREKKKKIIQGIETFQGVSQVHRNGDQNL